MDYVEELNMTMIIAVTACPSGVAHTYMAAEAIERSAKVQGWQCKVETQGTIGLENELTAEDVAAADVVILTNLTDRHNAARVQQLANHGIHARVFTNQGPKGPALQKILDEYRPSHAVFIDDLPQHHGSVKEVAPHIDRLHLCGEPSLAPHISCAFQAGHAHARIDTWEHALPWLLKRLHGESND